MDFYLRERIDVLSLGLRVLIYTLLGELFTVTRMFGLAEKIYRGGLRYAEKKRPGLRAMFYGDLGFLYERKGELNKALEMYKEALRLNPEEAFYYFEVAEVYRKQNKLKLAIENYEEGLQKDTEFTEESRAKIRSIIDELNKQLKSMQTTGFDGCLA